MDIVDYENIVDVSLSIADSNNSGVSNNSAVPWLNTPMIDASTSVTNIPQSTVIMEWTFNVVRWWVNTVNFSCPNENTVDWTSWTITMPDWTEYSIAPWTTGVMTWITYIFLSPPISETVLQTTTDSGACVWENKLLVCVAKPQIPPKKAVFQVFWTNTQDAFITADNIAANSITANELQVNTLSAISADMWSINAWTITLNSAWHIKWWQTNYNTWTGFFLWVSWWLPKFSIWNPTGNFIAFNGSTISMNVPIAYSSITGKPTIPTIPSYIKNTYIDSTTIKSPTISAWSITWTTITWSTIQTSTGWQRIMLSSDNTIRFYNSGWLTNFLYWWTFSNSNWTQNCLILYWNSRFAWNIVPFSDKAYDLWSTLTNRWRDIYMSGIIRFERYVRFSSWWYNVVSQNNTSTKYLPIRISYNWVEKTYKLLLA